MSVDVKANSPTDSGGEVAVGALTWYMNYSAITQEDGPSTPVIKSVRWVKTGKVVNLVFYLKHTTAAAVDVNGVEFALPAGCPAPAQLWALEQDYFLSAGVCQFNASDGGAVNSGQTQIYYAGATPMLFCEHRNSGTVTGQRVYGQVTYLTA